MHINENNVVEQLCCGNELAYKYIYDHYYGYLCCVAKGYVGDDDAAERVVGDVIFDLWRMRDKLHIDISLRSYLIRSVKNRSLNHLRQEYLSREMMIGNTPDFDEIEQLYFVDERHPLEQILEEELDERIRRAIDALPQECRTAFMLSRYHNLKYDEIEKRMGISVNTVKYHIKNALARLRVDLKEYLALLFLLLH
jgi:RNA polymerase sigma-70 factor (ECF subfamily)